MAEGRRPVLNKIAAEYFPIEITTKIILLLPVRSLVRFRAVCKTWKNQIDEPGFNAVYFRKEFKSGNKKPTFLFLPTKIFKTLHIVEQEGEEEEVNTHPPLFKSTKMSLSLPQTKLGDNIFVIGAVNGLFCFAYYDNSWIEQKQQGIFCAIISNPFTQQFVKLPKLVYSQPDHVTVAIASGFGYDSPNNQFKLLFMVCRKSPSGIASQAEAHVFTLGSCSWKKLNNAPNVICQGGSVAVEGSLHWLTSNGNLLSFVLASERFGFIPLPETMSSPYSGSITDFDGCLCIIDHYVWVMKDYGVRKSWTKFVVTGSNAESMVPVLRKIKPISFLKNGEMLLLCESSKLVSYSFESDRCTPVHIDGLPESHDGRVKKFSSYQVYPYFGNLTSLQPSNLM